MSKKKCRSSENSVSADKKTMGSFLSFAETLERKIRREIGRELQSDQQPNESVFRGETTVFPREWDSSPRGMAWLIGETPRKSTFSEKGRTAYGVKVRPLPPHKLTLKEKSALQFFAQHSVTLSPRFTKSELKKCFRGLACRLHPDAGGLTSQFIELKANFDLLIQFLDSKA